MPVTPHVRRAGCYLLGPKLGMSPVKSIVQCLARKEGTDDFYQVISGQRTIFGDLSRIWLLLTPICYQNFLLATWSFWLLLKTWQTTGFGSISLCFNVDIFAC